MMILAALVVGGWLLWLTARALLDGLRQGYQGVDETAFWRD